MIRASIFHENEHIFGKEQGIEVKSDRTNLLEVNSDL
jgi:hypothetical protein